MVFFPHNHYQSVYLYFSIFHLGLKTIPFFLLFFLLNKILNPLFQTVDVLYGEGKLRDLGMVFKPSFKVLKNKKINFSSAIL
jgi:hypothetical protein